ncbi:MAG: 2-oxoacid:acceptor oxidoreductase subunit alpha [Thermoproteota archaeon]
MLIALNQESIEKHAWRLKEKSLIIFDSSQVKANGFGLPLSNIIKNKKLPLILRNTIAIGALASILGIDFSIVKDVIQSTISKNIEENIEVAEEGYNLAKGYKSDIKVVPSKNQPHYLLTGNEALALGAIKAGLEMYVAYSMTPSSSILHYLAANEDKLNISVIHPENEIAVIGMAEGAAYAGVRAMVGTSGGGFSLMVEHLSLSGQAEIPIVIVLSQRPGPATGVPTYSAQGELFFAIFAGHGEFPRIVVAPGDANEAFYLSAEALNLAWKFQIPVILLSDKNLSESTYAVDIDENKVEIEKEKDWNKNGEYKRYLLTEDGVSPLAFPGTKDAIIKVNSYEHDEYGITTEEPELITRGHEKRLRKMKAIENELKSRSTVKTYGNIKSDTVLVTWGATKGAVVEISEKYDLFAVQPLYLYPLPVWELNKYLKQDKNIVDIELNSKAQLSTWLKYNGFKVDANILKYDGRPFSVNELEKRINEVIKK